LPPSLPEAIGKYSVERFIESGGMGDVYLARDPALDRPVAIKFLREGFDNEEMRQRFEREARAAGRLSHPNIVTIYEFGEFDRRPFIAMEFVRGEPLSKLIRRREPIPLVRKLEMMEGLCAGLAHAHKAGIVHRDIKPANLMVDLDGPLKILDFGIVRMAGSGLTSHGVLVGTINYMSPEQIAGSGAIDHRSDVFAVGAVLHEVFTYQRAFPGEMTDVLYKIVHTQPESAAVLAPGLDPGIVRAIDQCLQKAPERRYQDLNVLRRDLARIRQRLEVEELDHGPTAVTTAAAEAAARARAEEEQRQERARVEEQQRQERARAERERAERERAERERAERERAERDRAARERAERERAERLRLEQAEQARQEQIRQEQIRQEQIRQEQARQEQARAEAARAEAARAEAARAEAARAEAARLEAARVEEARQARLQAEAAERARVERERAEAARLAEARQAREEAERKRAEEQRLAREEAERQAAARREQRQRDLADAAALVTAGRFPEALQRLSPWIAEAGTDPAFAGLLRQAQAGVAKLEAEKKAREALQREVAAAADLLVRQDLTGASRAVQAILQAHPGHPPAKNLEREIVLAFEIRGKAESAVQRARAIFDAQPGEAMALLERFTPPHSLVDGALAELRATYAARVQARQRQEREARRREAIARVRGQVRTLAGSRAVQAGAALLVIIVAVALWRGLAPPAPTVNPGPAAGAGEGPGSLPGPAPGPVPASPPASVNPPGGTAAGGGVTPKTGGEGEPHPVEVSKDKPTDLTARATNVPKVDTPVARDREKPRELDVRTRDGGALPNRAGTSTSTPAGGTAAGPEVSRPAAGQVRDGVNAGNTAKPAGGPGPVANPPPPVDPGPRRDPQPAPPTQPDPVAVTRAEIQRWMASYVDAYLALDTRRVKELNPKATISPLLKSVRLSFSNVAIDVTPDGKTAVLRADARYEYEWKRSGPPESSQHVVWELTKVGSTWVVR
jgi:hypothetical protein